MNLKSPFTQTLMFAVIVLVLGLFAVQKNFPQKQAPTTPTSSSELKKVIQPNAFFYTKVFLDRENTFISLPYKFENTHHLIWLYLQSAAGEKTIIRLVSHPQLYQLDWPNISTDNLTLYQRKPTYESVSDFINTPPDPDKIIMDFSMTEVDDYSHITQNKLEGEFDLDKYDYILTTYIPPREADEVLYYEAVFNTSNALINDLNEMVWLIKAPNATDTDPFYLGTIHVDYR